eukprot:6201106-Pleurochrysis_carterae.AAC.1
MEHTCCWYLTAQTLPSSPSSIDDTRAPPSIVSAGLPTKSSSTPSGSTAFGVDGTTTGSGSSPRALASGEMMAYQ